jgi:hypothetical protein
VLRPGRWSRLVPEELSGAGGAGGAGGARGAGADALWASDEADAADRFGGGFHALAVR